MQFTPRTEEEIQRDQLCPEGFWPFTVLESKEQASKSEKNNGRMMFAIKLNIHADGGDSHRYDYFADWFNAHKLRHFFVSTGREVDYATGNMDGTNNAFQGYQGYLRVRIKKDKKTGEMVNEIVDYLTEAEYVEEIKGDEKPQSRAVASAAPNQPPVERSPFDDIPT